MSKPIKLLDYDAFEQLAIWVKENQDHRPRWTISLFNKKYIKCQLTFVFGDCQMGGLDQVENTVEEAVYLALNKYKDIKRYWT